MDTSENGPSVDQYFELLDVRNQLSQQIAAASETTRDLFEQSLSTADDRLASFEDNHEFQTEMQRLGSPVLRAFSELDTLTQVGLLPADVIDARRQELQARINADPRMSHIISYLGRTAKVVEEAPAEPTFIPLPPDTTFTRDDGSATIVVAPGENIEVAPPATPEASGEQLKKSITITYRDGVIQIGQQGKFVKTSGAKGDHQRDHTEERLAFLETLIKHQGEMVQTRQLWEETFPDIRPTGRATQAIKLWLENLTFRRQPIVVHSGKRGYGGAYGIMDFEVELVKKTVTRQQVEVPAPTTPTYAINKLEEVVEACDDQASVEVRETTGFPLTIYESQVLAEFLNVNSNVLTYLGMEPISGDMLERLRDTKANVERQQQIAINLHGTINQVRQTILANLKEFFADADRVIDTIDRMAELDERYELFSYLYQIEGEDRWQLFEQLIDADRGFKFSIDTARGAGWPIAHITPIIEVGGVNVLRGTSNQVAPEATPVAPAAEAPVELVPNQSVDLAETETTAAAPQHEESEERQNFKEVLGHQIREWITLIEAYSLAGKNRVAAQSLFPFLTARFVRNASENNLISRNGRTFTMTDLLSLAAFHHSPDSFAVRNSATKPDRRLVSNIIKDETRSWEATKAQSAASTAR